MDHLDRLYHALVREIRANHPQFLTQPFEVAELYQTILPYRLHRRSLGIETNQDYEATLMELLAGERGYLLVDERMRDALRRELASPNPDPAAFRLFATAQVSLAHEPLRQAEARLDADALTEQARPTSGMPATPEQGLTGGLEAQRPSPPSDAPPTTAPAAPPAAGSRTVASPPAVSRPSAGAPRVPTPAAGSAAEPASVLRGVVAEPGDGCRFCGGALPAGRRIVYCPHCGQDLTVQHCLACGTELELGWKFCISCGRSATAS